MVQSDREGIVGGEDELRVSLPPIPVVIWLPNKSKAANRKGYLMQAMFTGADAVAWYTMVGKQKANIVPQVFLTGFYMFYLLILFLFAITNRITKRVLLLLSKPSPNTTISDIPNRERLTGFQP